MPIEFLTRDRERKLRRIRRNLILIVNALPVIGVAALGWEIGEVMLYLWLEAFCILLMGGALVLTGESEPSQNTVMFVAVAFCGGGYLLLSLFAIVHFVARTTDFFERVWAWDKIGLDHIELLAFGSALMVGYWREARAELTVYRDQRTTQLRFAHTYLHIILTLVSTIGALVAKGNALVLIAIFVFKSLSELWASRLNRARPKT